MSERVEQITNELRKTADDAKATFSSLSPEQLNWRPSEDGWSVGQCLDHLIRTNTAFFEDFDQVAAGTRKSSFWEKWSPFSGFCGRFLIRAYESDSRKIKVPSKSLVPPSSVDPNVVEQFRKHTDEVIEKVRSTASRDWKNTVLTSPFLRVMTYTLDDYYTILVGHNKKHFRQALRVTETSGFPGATGEPTASAGVQDLISKEAS